MRCPLEKTLIAKWKFVAALAKAKDRDLKCAYHRSIFTQKQADHEQFETFAPRPEGLCPIHPYRMGNANVVSLLCFRRAGRAAYRI